MSWLTVTAGASGSGNGTVSFSATANASTSQRTGTLHGRWPDVHRDAGRGARAAYAIAPTTQSVGREWGPGVDERHDADRVCVDGGQNNTSWLTVTAGASGSGNGTVSFSTTANASTSQRTGTLTVGGQTFTVTQAGGALRVCDRADDVSRSVATGGAGVDERHDADRVCVDGGQQQHELVDGDGGGLGQRQRDGELQRDGEREHESAHGHAHGGWPDVQRDAGRGGMSLCDRADESIGRSRAAGRGRRASRRRPGVRGPRSATARAG